MAVTEQTEMKNNPSTEIFLFTSICYVVAHFETVTNPTKFPLTESARCFRRNGFLNV